MKALFSRDKYVYSRACGNNYVARFLLFTAPYKSRVRSLQPLV